MSDKYFLKCFYLKEKQIKLSATLNFSQRFLLNGTLSVLEGLFTISKSEEYKFFKDGNIEFEYHGENFSFPIKNLGGKYFIKDFRI